MSKRMSTVLVLVALAILCGIPIFAGNTTVSKSVVISLAYADSISAARKEQSDLVTAVSVGDQELAYDSASNLYFYSLNEGDKSAFTPNLEVTSNYDSVKACFVEDTIDADMIKNNESIRVLFYNDEFYCYSALKCTTLPILNIDCGSFITQEYSDMRCSLYDNRADSDRRLTISDGQIRKRGGLTAQLYPKIPLRFKLQYHSPGSSKRSYVTSLLGMKENNSWILYPAYNDEDKIRNVFSQNLWYDTVGDDNCFGVQTGPEYRYLEVFMNGRYNGLYALGYTIDEKSMEIDPNDDDQGLYKKVLDTRYDLLEMRDRNEDAVRGYRLISDEGDVSGRISGKWRALADFFVYLNENKKDSRRIESAIDLDNAIDFQLFTNLVQGDDSVYKNFYLAIKKDSWGNVKTLYCPWDLDASWGNEYVETSHNKYGQYSHTSDYNFFMEDTYLEQIFVNGDTDLMDRYIDRYRQLRSDLWSDESIIRMLDGYEKDIFASGAYLREMERWPGASLMAGPKYDLSHYKEYVLERFSEYDAYFDRLESVEGEPTLTRRAAAQKHFYESDYVLEIKNRDILGNEEYVSFIESIAPIDISKITDDVRYIVYLRGQDQVFYIPDIGDLGNSYVDGEVILAKDTYEDADYWLFYDDYAYTIFLNGIPCYDSSSIVDEGLIVSAIYQGYGQKMNTALDYDLEIDGSVNQFYDDLSGE